MSRTRFGLPLSLCAMLATSLLPLTARANVFPSNLFQSANNINANDGETITFSYLLNEAATSADVDVVDATNSVVRTIPGGTAKGTHSVVWDGKDDANQKLNSGHYSFRVSTAGTARATWTLISTDSDNVSRLNHFETPMGVGVNANPNSPYYGRLYVANGRSTNTGSGRAMSDAVYMLNADLTDDGIAGGTGPHAGGVTWRTTAAGDTTPSSPFRVQVGPDDSVYITDWSDAHSGLWQAPANLSGAWTEVLDSTISPRAGSGVNATHGSVADVVITGTGASRTIYSADEDFVPGGGTTGSILRYDIGNAPTFSGAPSGFAFIDPAPANRIQNGHLSLARANNGTFWMTQRRDGGAADTLPSLVQIDGNTGTILWQSVPTLAANSLADPLRSARGLAYDPTNDVLAIATNLGNLIIFDPNTKLVLATFTFAGTSNTDVAFDNVGNLYATNRSAERVRIWSPPNGQSGRYVANDDSTSSLVPLGTIRLIGVPEPTALALCLLAAIGLFGARCRK